MADRSVQIASLDPDFAEFLRECEASGRRTVFLRNATAVAVLLSMDEYIALRETVALAGSEPHAQIIAAADEEIRRGAMLLPEDLLVE